MGRASLSRRVALFTTLGLAAVWAGAVLLMAAVLWSEQDELFDQQLVETAHVLLPLVSRMQAQAVVVEVPQPDVPMDEALLYRLVARDGRVLRQSAQAGRAVLPDPAGLAPRRVVEAAGYRLYATPFNASGHALQIAAPLAERREAFREGMTGFLLPMAALLPLTWLIVGWVSRRSLAPLRELGAEISARDSSRLDMIDAGDWPQDLMQIAGVVNGFMARLSQALQAERAFATNAAHELRTPVAIALAQTQQLRESATAPAQIARLDALERALQRMRRLVARLLQLARADAGIGDSAVAHDLAALTRLVIAERALPDAARLDVDLPSAPVMARMDPDAFAIVLSNLIDNALQHAPPGSPVQLRLRQGAVLEIANPGRAVASADLAGLTQRFARHGGDGFGLGLHICQQIVSAAGGRLEIVSPAPSRTDGFVARVTLPPPPDREA
ncbi:two-component system, OmpR family, sensor kinase [Paracoccus aminovorans]|uniref:histidine kinase n=1 Tax=Paracoccus aminovorans TaxID=34004 RepID=A0A1I3EVR1_9RHOB|nr:ATP-binding protein [Paracoccus aminovorans]CQR86892.1 histidine kinase [Paracoccus aminovorans]SFI03047.1 two-component system, OmpR family, sensor kinase [Paracoccus aminovorans]